MKAKKLLSVILALCMTLSMVQMTSITAFAGGGEGEVAAVYNINGQLVYSNTTVQSCIDYASAGYTVKLISNACENITIQGDDNITLDLNGYVLKGDGTNHVIINYGNLTIKDSNPTSVHHFSDSDAYTGLWVWDDTETATTHIVNGGVITGGVYSSGGGIYNCNATLTMNGGNIVGNLAKVNMGIAYGGGVYNHAQNDDGIDAVFTMNSGSIMGNATMCNSTLNGSGSYGAGVCNNGQYSTDSCAVFTMTGGSISNNTANKKNSTFCCGGGIENTGFYNFTMTGGTVSDNKAKANGGGVRVQNTTGGTATIGGSAVISGNTLLDGTTASNLYLNNTTINISTETTFVSGANVGVALSTGTGQFTSNGTKADEAFFFSDNASYTDKYNDAGTSGVTSDDYLELVQLPTELANATYATGLTLSKSIALNFQMSGLGSGFTKDKLTITVDGDTISNVGYDSTNGIISCVIASDSPDKIGDSHTISVTYDGTEIKNFSYSAKEYCKAILESSEYGESTKEGAVCKALLNYGKYAEDYVNGNTASTINEGYEINFANYNLSGINESTVKGTAGMATLELGSTIKLIYYVKTDKDLSTGYDENGAVDKDNPQNFYILNGNSQIDPKRISVAVYTKDNTYDYIVSVDLYAYQLSNQYTLKLKGVSTSKFCISYGVYNYCNDAQGQTAAAFTDTLKTLCKSIYNYGEAVKAYLAQ